MNPLDFILNGQVSGGSAVNMLLRHNFDPYCLKPYVAPEDGRSYITMNRNGTMSPTPIRNEATLLRDEWLVIDRAVIQAAKPRLRAWGDLQQRGLTFNVPGGMGKTIIQYATGSDISPAAISMNGLRKSDRDRILTDLHNLPLPIIHKDFSFDARELAVARSPGGPGLDTTMAELAARRVAEEAEKFVIGVSDSYTYGGGTVYGYVNFPNRLTFTLSNPTAGTWNAGKTVKDILAMKALSQAHFYYGPWMVYVSPQWDEYMDDDFSAAKGDNTLRQRIRDIDNILDVRTLDYLTGYQIVMVQMDSSVVRAVTGMGLTTLQWEEQGGMLINFKVMAIMVPQLRADQNGNTGIVHGNV
jgi:hypothetical protein